MEADSLSLTLYNGRSDSTIIPVVEGRYEKTIAAKGPNERENR